MRLVTTAILLGLILGSRVAAQLSYASGSNEVNREVFVGGEDTVSKATYLSIKAIFALTIGL